MFNVYPYGCSSEFLLSIQMDAHRPLCLTREKVVGLNVLNKENLSFGALLPCDPSSCFKVERSIPFILMRTCENFNEKRLIDFSMNNRLIDFSINRLIIAKHYQNSRICLVSGLLLANSFEGSFRGFKSDCKLTEK